MKLIERTDYMNEIKELSGTPDIKVITGVRRCGKSKLMDAFVQYIKGFDKDRDLDSYDVEDYVWERPDLEVPYYDDKFVIVGHTPTLAITGEAEIIVYNKFVNIDCGACFNGGKLACLCLDTLQEYYV